MGRIRKALSIGSVIATGGALGTPVRWESSAEKAAKEQERLLDEHNRLLAEQNRLMTGRSAPGRPTLEELEARVGIHRPTVAELEEELGTSHRETLADLEERLGIQHRETGSATTTATKVCLECLGKHCDARIGGLPSV